MKIPILMYHDVLEEADRPVRGRSNETARLYNLSKAEFDLQMTALKENGYIGVSLEEFARLRSDDRKNHVVLTFDDGLRGNFECVLPILQSLEFTATFFVVAGAMGTGRFMSWEELDKLRKRGMSVQSHTMSHKSLETLTENATKQELRDSKELLEARLGATITSISFPHGSYNKSIVQIAQDVGYDFLCTSEYVTNYYDSHARMPRLLGRIAVTDKMTPDKLLKLVEYDGVELAKLRAIKEVKNGIKKIIGINNYRKIYRAIFNIKINS